VGVLGGVQAIHVPAYDEAFAIPTEESARIGLRTQQIIAFETGIPKTADPLGGSYYLESLTDDLENRAQRFLEDLEKRGGLIACLRSGYVQKLIQDRAYEREKQIQSGERPVVGVNCCASGATESLRLMEVDFSVLERQKRSLQDVKEKRNSASVAEALGALKGAAERGENFMEKMLSAVKAYATIGEITRVLRQVYGEHRETESF
jgi:methylmalonyl-CoA mutase N-terminal domain/subunit